jgi:hypothetical protein
LIATTNKQQQTKAEKKKKMGSGSSSTAWREKAVVNQIRAQNEVCNRLHAQGQSCPGYFRGAIDKAHSSGAISNSNASRYIAINQAANKGKHNW